MTPNPVTIADIEKLGYACGLSSGCVQTEHDALTVAQAGAHPDVIVAQTITVASETVKQMDADGHLPVEPEARRSIVEQITDSVLDAITTRANDLVDFHTRAVAIAQEMPNTWHVEGWGTAVYVSCKADGTGWDDDAQQLLDALADPGSHSERVWQHDNQEPMAASWQLQQFGFAVVRPDLGGDAFTVDGKTMKSTDLIAFAETAKAKPTMEQIVARALADDPALSDATKKTIRAALGA